ncbi:MAG TPA: YceI family protein [Dinghuibacter sp.]|uniref:YceI family protein n=1 Tax=Dinghuibacter sp. TaxID=2024697 RepID=UPI002C89A496|nr:YceI family protein [Dinghuibacter sp.]HTJ11199.1 YceI family protein [Dinghuibacter sp.]
MKFLPLLFVLFLPQSSTVDTSNAVVSFSVKGPLGGTVHGTLGGLKADIKFDEHNLSASSMHATVDVKTIKTGNDKRDRDLCNESTWFDVAKNPTIAFTSRSITKAASGYAAAGDLTIKGVTKPYTIPFTFDGKVFKGTFVVKRQDFDLGKMVGDEVTVNLTVPVKR